MVLHALDLVGIFGIREPPAKGKLSNVLVRNEVLWNPATAARALPLWFRRGRRKGRCGRGRRGGTSGRFVRPGDVLSRLCPVPGTSRPVAVRLSLGIPPALLALAFSRPEIVYLSSSFRQCAGRDRLNDEGSLFEPICWQANGRQLRYGNGWLHSTASSLGSATPNSSAISATRAPNTSGSVVTRLIPCVTVEWSLPPASLPI